MNEKKFNKIFGTTLMVLMIAVIVCITIIKQAAKMPSCRFCSLRPSVR